MFVIKSSQLEAFNLPIRKQERLEILSDLKAMGFDADESGERDLIIRDSKGNVTTLLFDKNYAAEKIKKPSGTEYKFSYNKDGRLAKLSYPGNEYVGFEYDARSLIGVSLNENKIGFGHNKSNLLAKITYPDGRETGLKYNEYNHLESISNGGQEVKRYERKIVNNRLLYTSRDSLGRVTKFESDPLGSYDKISFANGQTEETVFDEESTAYETVLRDGSTKTTYFNGSDIYKTSWDDGNFSTINFNDKLQVAKIEGSTGVIGVSYDEKARVSSEEFGGNSTYCQYDIDGLLTRITYQSGSYSQYVYDQDDKLKEVSVNGQACRFEYADNETVSEIRYPNGLIEVRTEKILGGLQQVSLLREDGTVVSKQNYQYDNLDRLTKYKIANEYNLQEKKEWCLIYDDEDRLILNSEINSKRLEKFEYDRKGNFKSIDSEAVSVGLMDEILAIGEKYVEYDGLGNVTSFYNDLDEIVRLNFNKQNLLETAQTGHTTTYFFYDPLGRRIAKSNGNISSLFYWSGEKLVAEKYTLNGALVLREYIYRPDWAIPTGFIEGGKIFWLHYDVRGAVIQVSDNLGSIKWSATYDSFGVATIGNSELHQPWRLMGQYYDEETGLNYSIGRYYSTAIKSYLSMDTFWYYPNSSNYSYCGNDPYNRVDTSGRFWHVLIGAGVGAIVGGVMEGVAEGSIEGVLKGALKGGLTGAATAIGGFGGAVAMSAAIAAAENIYKQIKGGSKFCTECFFMEVGFDVGLTVATAGLNRLISVKILAKLGKNVRVTSWAEKGIPDFAPDRQVIIGGKNRFNHVATGTILPHTSRAGKKVGAYPFKTGRTVMIPASSLKPIEKEPIVSAYIKMIFLGQYQIK